MSSPILRARRTALSLLLAALLALLVPGLKAWADPAPTQIQASVAADTAGRESSVTVPVAGWEADN